MEEFPEVRRLTVLVFPFLPVDSTCFSTVKEPFSNMQFVLSG